MAEVLITLTIIGVIAALTIPNLMQSYRKHQVEVGVKSAYSLLNNALSMAKAEYGSFQEIIEDSNRFSNEITGSFKDKTDYFTNKYLKPYLKYSKSCDYGTYNTCKVFPVDYYKKLDGTTENIAMLTPNFQSATLALSNGMLLGFLGWGSSFTFIVDINGSKGPNQLGVDTFLFSLSQPVEPDSWNFKYTLPGERLVCGNGGVIYNPAAIANGPDPSWNPNTCNDRGYGCSCAIMHNNWKIPDDYPVKKF